MLVCFLVASAGLAQTITGTITGTVTDPSGAVIPNVKITATNVGTNLNYNGVSNEAGVYNLLFLPIGNYNVAAKASGFKKSVLGPFRLEVAQVARVDIKMEVGEVTQAIEITDFAPILQTETTQTGDVISATQIDKMMLNGRNFITLTLLVPGSVTPNPGSISGVSRAFSGGRPFVNGNREQTNNFLLDGLDINETIDNLVGYNPNVDAIGEIKISTGNAPAEFGNANGAIVNMALKSGTNSLHGNVFEFLRNDNLDANGFFANRSGAVRRELKQSIFGGTLGGPIIRDRHFFFIDYQGQRQVSAGRALASLALPEYRVGNLSRFPQVIRDPLLSGNCSTSDRTACFQNNTIPQARIVNPVAKVLFADQRLYPLPNTTGTGNIGVTNNYISSSSSSIRNDQADAKIDSRLSEKDNVSGRFTIARYESGTKTVAVPIFLGGGTDAPTTGGVINWTRTISPSLVNEARIGYNRTVIRNLTTDPAGVLGKDGNQKLGIAGGQLIAGASSVPLGDGMSGVGASATVSDTLDNTFQYGDNLSYVTGRHSIKMGLQLLRYQQNRFYAGNNGVLGNFRFTGDYTGSTYADFLLNQLRGKGRGDLQGKWGHRHSRVAMFLQDDFKVRPNITLNLGLRWEYTQPVYEVADRQSNIDVITGRQLFAGKDGNSRALFEPYYRQFMPRVGLAWTPGLFSNRFVVRAGYGITSYMEGTGANLRLPLNPPHFFESDVTYDLRTPGDIAIGFADATRPAAGQLAGGQLRAWNPQLRPAFIQQWNFSVEHQFSNTFSVNTAYVGQKGTHLVDPREYNQPLADPGPVATWRPLQQRRPLFGPLPLVSNISGTDSSATMDYHSLQVSGRKRYSNGLEFLTAYTLSKTFTDNLGYYGSGGVNAEGPYWQNAYDRRGNRGFAFFDARHIFSFGGHYELPVGRTRTFGKSFNRVVDSVLGGWTINYIVSMHSGFPITIQSNDRSNQAVRGNTRPNRFKSLTYQNQTIDTWFGTGNTFCLQPGTNDGSCAYGESAVGTFGNAAIGTERAPDFRNLDLGISKKFDVTERMYFDFRAEFFNVLNHVSFGPPGRSISAPTTFGFITGQITPPRNIEFALKFYF